MRQTRPATVLILQCSSDISQLTDILPTLNYFPLDLFLVIARHKKFKMMDLAVYYLCCTCQMWSCRPVFVDERLTLAAESKSNSCSNWGDCQSKAELTQSQEKPIRSTPRYIEQAGYDCPFNKTNKQVTQGIQACKHVCTKIHKTRIYISVCILKIYRHADILKLLYLFLFFLFFLTCNFKCTNLNRNFETNENIRFDLQDTSISIIDQFEIECCTDLKEGI